jgi:glycosyltransferase involved in cell wall biosynthesis
MSKPTLTVVMPNFNHAHCINEALEAIEAQSFRPLEVIVIDDGSTDDSTSVIEQSAKRYPIIRLLRNERNMGVVFSVNRGLQEASGDYVSLQAADDKLLPEHFEKSMKFLAQYPQAGVSSALSLVVDEQGKDLGMQPAPPLICNTQCFLPPDKVLATLQRVGSWCMGNTAIYRRHALLEAGGLLPELKSYCDGFVFQVVALRHGACFVPEPLGVFRLAENGYSSGLRNNVQEFLSCMERAEHLMRSTYSNVFPKPYVQEFRKRNLHAAGWMACRKLRAEQGEYLSDLRRSLEDSTLMDRLLLKGLQLCMALQYLGTQFYLILRHGRLTWPLPGLGFRSLSKNMSGETFRSSD